MKKEKFHNYFTSLSFLFFFEGVQQAILLPIIPYLLKQECGLSENQKQMMTVSNESIDLQNLELNFWKGQVAFYYGFFMLIYYSCQSIGMIFWSVYINQVNIKHCLIAMIFIQSASILVISMNLSITITFIMRAIQGIFACTIGVVKLTIDNKFNPSRDMQKVVDFSGLWFLGLAIGASLASVLNYTNYYRGLEQPEIFVQYPYLFAAIINCILQLISIVIIIAIYPQFSEKKKQYKKMQSTLFFQTVFFLSQNDYTYQVTRHQRTRTTFDTMLLKQILWKDRNLLFALVHQGLVYFTFIGFFDMLSIYSLTVLDINSELYLSNIYCVCIFAVFLYEMFGIDANYFEQQNDNERSNKDLFSAHLVGLLAFISIYLLRFITTINSQVFLVLTSIAFLIYCISACHILSQSNYLLEQTALQCGEDSDHARNLSQFNANMSKVFGTFVLCLCAAFNFWQYNHLYFGKNSLSLSLNLDFVYVYILILILLCLALLMTYCLDNKWREPDAYEIYQTTKLYNSEVNTSKNDVFA